MEKKVNDQSGIEAFLNVKEKFKNTHQGLVIFLHHVMLARGFRLVGLSEKGDPQDYQDVIRPDWNKSEESYTFKYKHSQSSLTYVIKLIPLSSNLIVSAACLEDPKPILLEIACTEYVVGDNIEKLEEYFKDLDKLEKLFIERVIDILLPTDSSKKKEEQKRDPLREEVRQPRQRHEDDYDPLRIGPIRSPNQFRPNQPFGNFGDSDLYPTFPGFGGDRGSQMGPNDPMFFGRFKPGPNQRRPPNVPQGARFDPYGPGPTNQGEPDPDHWEPPKQPKNPNRRFEDDDGDRDYFL